MVNMDVKITYNSLRDALRKALISDSSRILRKARTVFGTREKPVRNPDATKIEVLALETAAAIEKATLRAAQIPAVSYPEELPVSQHHEEIAELIRKHQVVVIAGDTGSGKTTQLPKICLEAGLGRRGMIGHTQPRRLAARTVADRISREIGVPLGTLVGYKVRFGDRTADNTVIKLMTDGILLSELENDRWLNDYEVIIVDEAHERSLNIDFILGFLHDLLKKRKDLKLIITSATIDVEKFARHFGNAPVKIVSGRTYPVEVRYEPINEEFDENDEPEIDDDDLEHAVLRAVDELTQEDPLGDILVFLNGEKDIADMAAFLGKCNLKGTEILPLYARLSNTEQNRVFQEHALRRIVLATNVAETSVTVPGIRYVIDPGTARISFYSPRTKVQRLPITRISQASANQRKGRSGRLSAGICIRLYSEQDFLSRPEFTPPEIQRTNLAQVILKMLSLRITDIGGFPFIDPPENRMINDGINLLEQLGAIEKDQNGTVRLTSTGKLMARFPCDPRFSRMLVESSRRGALRETLIITAALSARDVRERPLNMRQTSDTSHARFNDEKSDFISILRLYDYLVKLRDEQTASQMKKTMKKEFLSFLRMREWFDILAQIRECAGENGFKENTEPATYEELHMSLLSGVLGQIGMKSSEGYEYQGTRSTRFYIFPGSGVSRKAPAWIMAAEIAETSKVYARTVAAIDPLWLEKLAPHLVRYSWSDEYWSKKNGAVMAHEKGMFLGLTLFAGRTVNYTRHNPALCRELMIREGLVNGEFFTRAAFFRHNLDLVEKVEDLEEKSRHRDILVSEETLFAFYDERIPEDIADARSFEKWWQVKEKEDSGFLNYDMEMLKRRDTSMISPDLYPDHLEAGNFRIPLTYNFDPTKENDGVTAVIPITVLNQIPEDIFLWLIPGLRLELFTELIRALPKVLRRSFVPAPDHARTLFESLSPGDGYFWDALTARMTKMAGTVIKKEDFALENLPRHLSFYFRIVNTKGRLIAEGRDLGLLRHQLKEDVKNTLAEVLRDAPRNTKSDSWTFGTIPETETRRTGSLEVIAYPALHDSGDGVTLELYGSRDEADREMWQGEKRLIMLSIPSPLRYLESKLPNRAKLAMYFNAVGSVQTLIADLESLALDDIMESQGGACRDQKSFDSIVEEAKSSIYDRVLVLAEKAEQILLRANDVRKHLRGRMDLQTAYAFSDIGGELNRLVCKGFATSATMKYYSELPRYLDAMLKRIERLPRDPSRDRLLMLKCQAVEDRYESLLGMFSGKTVPREVHLVRYMLEELRVSLFAQSLGTMYPVSEKRVNAEIDRLTALYRS
ncbi:ATP-dependent RNA helicase HrpA [Succinimonas amylolytica]|uniref:ATP-dependent RNA helicase HrpA n=1 Tax=Succinimonas amylolytica TaxID=83769 RepID=UPI003D18F850